MANRDFFLLQTADGWSLRDSFNSELCFCDETESLTAVADRVADETSDAKGKVRLVIGLHSSNVLSDLVECRPADARNRSSLLYQFESTLPFPAEDLTSDFHPTQNGMFGVATLTNTVKPLVDRLEANKVSVHSVSPVTVLAIQSLQKDYSIDANALVVWDCGDGNQAEAVRLQNGCVSDWFQLPAEPKLRQQRLNVVTKRLPQGTDIVVVDFKDDRAIRSHFAHATQIETDSLDACAASFAADVLRGKCEPSFELRRDELAEADPIRSIRRPLQVALTMAALFLVALSIAFWYRATSFDNQVSELREQELQLFKRVFPGSRPPAGVLSRLESEHARLSGARGTNAASGDVPLPFPALTVLQKFLDGMPANERVQVSTVRINDGKLEVDTNLRNHSSAGVFVSALKEQGFAVVPPTSEQRDNKSVSSLIYGSLQPQQDTP
ncbi:hypothetical protein OAH18_01885 [bacterium]|nr:hypothetical protein [bacterium]